MKGAKLAHKTRDHGKHWGISKRRASHLKHARIVRWNSDKENVPPPTTTPHQSRAPVLPPPPAHQSRLPISPHQISPLVPPPQPATTPHQSGPHIPPQQISPLIPPASPATTPQQPSPLIPPTPPATTPHQPRSPVPPAPPAMTPHQPSPLIPPTPPATTPHQPSSPVPSPPQATTPHQSQPAVELNENRIINLSNLSMAFQVISTHATECGGECSLTGETYRTGLASVLQVRCEQCTEMFSIPSSKRVKTSDGRHWEVNLGAVLGQMMTGGGASRLATTMAAVGVPSMSKQTFTTTERAWSAEMEKQLVLSMKQAGAEEKQIAIEHGRSHHGVPAITVIVDGGWSKRSHKHSYNAKSGVAIIIGKDTKKLLFLAL